MCDEELCENGARNISGQIMRHVDNAETEAHSERVQNQERLSAESVSKRFVDHTQHHKGKWQKRYFIAQDRDKPPTGVADVVPQLDEADVESEQHHHNSNDADDEEEVEVIAPVFSFIKLFLPFCYLFLNFDGIPVFFHGEPPIPFFEHKHYIKYTVQVNTLRSNTVHLSWLTNKRIDLY